jgi:hypothetical protein
MALFDYVRMMRIMPDGFHIDGHQLYMTKDLDCSLSKFEVGEDNKLVVALDSKPCIDLLGVRHLSYTGDLVFYYQGLVNWHIYRATFIRSVMIGLITELRRNR